MVQAFTRTEFLAIVWVLFAIAVPVYVARLIIRHKVFGRFLLDDVFVTLAMCLLLTNVILETVSIPYMVTIQDVEIHHMHPPENFGQIRVIYSRLQWAIAYVFFAGVWSIKAAFLSFYEALTHNLFKFRIAWWAINVFTFLTWIGTMIAYALLNGRYLGQGTRKNKAINYQFSVDFVTDILITALPLTLAFKAKFGMKRRLGLTGIFSLSLVITVFSLARFIVNKPSNGAVPSTWTQVWSAIEQSTSVIIACATSFRALAVNKEQRSERYKMSGNRQGPSGGTVGSAGLKMPNSWLGRGHSEQSDNSMDMELLESTEPQASAKASGGHYGGHVPGIAISTEQESRPYHPS